MAIYGKNRTLLREGSYNEYAASYENGDILDCMIESVRTDYDIFETVIDNDFYHAYSEAGMLYITEADEEKKDGETKKGIFTRIKEFIQRIWEKIKSFFGGVKKKAEEVANNDENLYSKYADVVKKYGVGMKIKSKHSAKILATKFTDLTEDNDEILKSANEFSSQVQGLKEPTNAKNYESRIKPKLDSIIEKQNKYIEKKSEQIETKSEGKPEETVSITITADILNAILINMRMGLNTAIGGLNSMQKQIETTLNSLSSAMDIMAANIDKDEAREATLAMSSDVSKAVTTYLNSLAKLVSSETKAITNVYNSQRSAFVALGEKCQEKADEESEKKSNKDADEAEENNENKNAKNNKNNKNAKNNKNNKNAKNNKKKKAKPAPETPAEEAVRIYALQALSEEYIGSMFGEAV